MKFEQQEFEIALNEFFRWPCWSLSESPYIKGRYNWKPQYGEMESSDLKCFKQYDLSHQKRKYGSLAMENRYAQGHLVQSPTAKRS